MGEKQDEHTPYYERRTPYKICAVCPMENQGAVNEQQKGDLDPVRTGLQLIPIMTVKEKSFFITHPDEEALHLLLSHLSTGVQQATVPVRLNVTSAGKKKKNVLELK